MAHAYLISTNNIEKCMNVLLNVIKNIFCNEEFSLDCNKCSLCHLIDLNNLPSLKIIEPDGNFIKKEQINELKRCFSMESQFTKDNIYIIKNCEKMNKESANTMLKFLEEPEGSVIGFFLTTESVGVLPTIQSRCEYISCYFENDSFEKYNISKEKYEEYLNIVNNYIKEIESINNKSILINRDYFNELEKDDIKVIFQIMLDIYEKSYKNKLLNREIDNENIVKLSHNNLNKKVALIIEFLKEINYNVNLDLLLDRFVIEVEEVNNESI